MIAAYVVLREAGLQRPLLHHIHLGCPLLGEQPCQHPSVAANDQHRRPLAARTSCGGEAVGHRVELAAGGALRHVQVAGDIGERLHVTNELSLCASQWYCPRS